MLKKIFEKIRKMITVDKYYKMNDAHNLKQKLVSGILESIFSQPELVDK